MPQNQKTKTAAIEAPDHPLTVQEQFLIDAWLEGKPRTDCYRAAYGAEGYQPHSLRARASAKFAQPHIRAWVQYYRAAAGNNAVVTLEQHVERLDQLAARAEQVGNYGAAVNAEVNKGKAIGLYIERHEDVGKGAMDLSGIIEALLEALGDAVDKEKARSRLSAFMGEVKH